MFFTKEALDRRTVLRGIGATLALPAGALLPSPPGPSARAWPEVWVREADVRAAVAPYLGTQIPGLSVAVGYRGRVIFARGYGTADLASRRPVTAQTDLC